MRTARPLRVLALHERYRQTGGEDAVFDTETRVLESRGHEVERIVFDNANIVDDQRLRQRLGLGLSAIWSREGADRVRAAIRGRRPDIVHVHNTLPLMSPAALAVAHRLDVPTVLTLHNYRLICPAGTLLRDDAPCHDCVGRTVAMPAVVHACYRNSHSASAVVAAMLAVHRARGTWRRDVDVYIAMTEFSRRLLEQGGLPRSRLHIKPNLADIPPTSSQQLGHGYLFAGRLVPDKGIDVLLAAWRLLPETVVLTVAGDGLLRPAAEVAARGRTGISVLGEVPRARVGAELRAHRALVVPSRYYEMFPMVILEAFAAGRPVIAARNGGIPEIVEDGKTGLLFDPDDAAGLARAVMALEADPGRAQTMGAAAFATFEQKYAAGPGYDRLIEAYGTAVQRHERHRSKPSGLLRADSASAVEP